MELERLIEFVNEKLGGGDDLETIIAEFTDMGLCAPEQAAQLREHFVPSGVAGAEPSKVSMDTLPLSPPEQTAQHQEHVVPPSVPDNVIATHVNPTIAEPAPLSERSVPILQIDWGTGLKPGVPLQPKFTIKGDCQRLLLYLKIPQIELEQVPEPKKNTEGWYFHQLLQLDNPGQYLCQIVAIDPTPGFADPGYYHADFHVDVTDPKETGQQRSVEIHVGKDADVTIEDVLKDAPNANLKFVVGEGANVKVGESLADKVAKVFNPNEKRETESKPNSTVTIPFQPDPDTAKHVPYLFQHGEESKRVRRLTMTDSATKCYVLTGGQYLDFGRDDPDRNIQNDVPLEMLPETQEKNDHTDEFSILNGLFSRTHARLEVHQEGIYLLDRRTGGIRDATMLDNRSLSQGGKELMFSFEAESDAPRNVLFSKMLSMTFKPHRENFWEEIRNGKLSGFSLELLKNMYSLKTSASISSVCVIPEQHFKQKNHAGMLLSVLQKAAPQIADSDWWKQWFSKTNNVNPRYKTHEYWFIPSFVTLGGLSHNKIQLNSHWNDVRLRVLFLDDSLYVENISHNTAVKIEYGGTGDGRLHILRPFRPVPLCSGFFIQKKDVVLRFE